LQDFQCLQICWIVLCFCHQTFCHFHSCSFHCLWTRLHACKHLNVIEKSITRKAELCKQFLLHKRIRPGRQTSYEEFLPFTSYVAQSNTWPVSTWSNNSLIVTIQEHE
jgi:hypothetical protein